MKSSTPSKQVGLVWFRKDLRTADNPALSEACHNCDQILGIYILTEAQWNKHGIGANHQWFALEHVKSLRQELAKINIPLIFVTGSDYRSCSEILRNLCQQYAVTDLYLNGELEVNELERDSNCQSILENGGIRSHKFNEQTLAIPGSVKTKNDQFYKVYTPFKKAFISHILTSNSDIDPLPAPSSVKSNLKVNEQHLGKISSIKHTCDAQWKVGEAHAKRQMMAFVGSNIIDYHRFRDVPSLDATSMLSPYLAVGAISLRQCFYEAFKANDFRCQSDEEGITTWINELIWREFYRHIVVGFPHVCKYQPLNKDYQNVPWRSNKAEYKAWCQGETGYPIVDAAMKQLVQTGWMHNRLRMVVAMFLTKHLLLDWRKGEAFFLEHLIDADFSANNGGWQWSASTGADAAPYFRIFNPTRQSERFDSDGVFIKKYLPQLKDLSRKSIHSPSPVEAKSAGYPLPVIDHRFAVERAKQTFRSSREEQAYGTEQAS